MDEQHGTYILRVHPMPAWSEEEGYSTLGFIDDSQKRQVGSLMLRGPFCDWEQARQAGLAALHEMASEIEVEEQGRRTAT
jgi:hypothetical protein